jgi:DNA-binding CsgD family transcriptional regulator
MRFDLTPDEDYEANDWKAAIHALAERIPMLQKQGCHIVQAVRLALHWNDADRNPTEAIDESMDNDATDHFSAAKAFANQLASEAATHSVRIQAAVEQHPRLIEFVDGAATIVVCLPRLRIPTNGYLFEIAMTIYLDESKKRGRQKRGGTAQVSSSSTPTTSMSVHESTVPHPIEILTLDPGPAYDSAHSNEETGATARSQSVTEFSTPAVDPTLQYENEDLFEKFYEYLRKPVSEATIALVNAQSPREVNDARRKLESLTAKFSRTTAVLALMGEGYTQERIAEQLSLSRNQVKYIIELVQEAYARFAGDSTRPAHSSKLRVQSNVP